MSSWTELACSAATSALYVANLVSGSQDSSSSASVPTPAPIKRFDIRMQRAAMNTIVHVALFGLEPIGSKLNFVANALVIDPPSSSVQRTGQNFFASIKGEMPVAKRDMLPDLQRDFIKACQLFSNVDNAEDLQAVQKLFFYAVQGLDAIGKTYPESQLVNIFIVDSKRILNKVISMKAEDLPSPTETKLSKLNRIQRNLYSMSEIKVLVQALEDRNTPTVKSILENKNLTWQTKMDECMERKFE